MGDRPYKILIAEPDPDMVEMLVAALADRFNAHITCVATGDACIDIDMVRPQDLVIAEWHLTDTRGLQLVEHLSALSARPIVLLADNLSRSDAVEALRLGVHDLFVKPFAVVELLDTAARALRSNEVRRLHMVKYRRMRDLLRRVIRERRELHQRVDLICRDLVGAHRRLVHRVLDNGAADTERGGRTATGS